jgi:SulP family sulfate permease
MASLNTWLRNEFQDPKQNLFAGLTVAVVALPLALAFGVSSGLGASSGLITAVIAGAVAAIFGGSRWQVSGPTGAMTVVLLPIFANYGSQGVLTTGLMAGVILVLAWLLKIGRHVHKIPTAIIEGFTAGIAIVIALQQIPNAINVASAAEGGIWHRTVLAFSAFNSTSWAALLVACMTTALVLLIEKFKPRLPAVLLATTLATLGSVFLSDRLPRIGNLPNLLAAPTSGFLRNVDFGALLPAALAVATLAALESLLSAKIADKLAGAAKKHDSDRELLGQGLANLVVPFFGGVPATAALARTAVNVRAGATNKTAALFHSLFLALIVLAAPGLVGFIPLSTLAGILFATCYRMIKLPELIALGRESRLDLILLVATFATTIAFDLVTAVLVGLSILMMLRKTNWAKVDRRYPPVDSRERLGD